MQQQILDYIKTQRVGVLAVKMLDGSPHAATVHFAHTENPLAFYFETSSNYRKAEPLLKQDKTRASLVIGFNESDMKTLQLDGVIELVKPEIKEIDEMYLGKFPARREKLKGPDVIFFTFKPTWWRFTDWHTPQGKIIITSDK